jgi:hypothetical protein
MEMRRKAVALACALLSAAVMTITVSGPAFAGVGADVGAYVNFSVPAGAAYVDISISDPIVPHVNGAYQFYSYGSGITDAEFLVFDFHTVGANVGQGAFCDRIVNVPVPPGAGELRVFGDPVVLTQDGTVPGVTALPMPCGTPAPTATFTAAPTFH